MCTRFLFHRKSTHVHAQYKLREEEKNQLQNTWNPRAVISSKCYTCHSQTLFTSHSYKCIQLWQPATIRHPKKKVLRRKMLIKTRFVNISYKKKCFLSLSLPLRIRWSVHITHNINNNNQIFIIKTCHSYTSSSNSKNGLAVTKHRRGKTKKNLHTETVKRSLWNLNFPINLNERKNHTRSNSTRRKNDRAQ